MVKEIFYPRNPENILQATLCFLIRKDCKEILLAMKKRGFAEGKWNGTGGKRNGEETIEETAKRETLEEIGVKIQSMQKVAVLHFYFPSDSEKFLWNQDVHVYLVEDWIGDPTESEEMKPKWFNVKNIPFSDMWEDDIHWLPLVLQGKEIIGYFAFDEKEKMIAKKIIEVKK